MAATLPELELAAGDVVHTGPVVAGVPATPSEPTVLVSLSTFAFRGLEDVRWLRPDAVVVTLPCTGHVPQLERPAAFAAALERVLAALPAS